MFKIMPDQLGGAKTIRLWPVFPALFLFFFGVSLPIAHAESIRVDQIYSIEETVASTTTTGTANYWLADGGEVDEPIRCENDGSASEPWIVGQRLPAMWPAIERVAVRARAVSAGVDFQIQAFISTAAMASASATPSTIICTGSISDVKNTTAFSDLTSVFSPACELEPDKAYFLYIGTKNCETWAVGVNAPNLARKYDAWGGRRYYDFYRTTSIINDYDLHAKISWASTTETTTQTTYTAPIIIWTIAVFFFIALAYLTIRYKIWK